MNGAQRRRARRSRPLDISVGATEEPSNRALDARTKAIVELRRGPLVACDKLRVITRWRRSTGWSIAGHDAKMGGVHGHRLDHTVGSGLFDQANIFKIARLRQGTRSRERGGASLLADATAVFELCEEVSRHGHDRRRRRGGTCLALSGVLDRTFNLSRRRERSPRRKRRGSRHRRGGRNRVELRSEEDVSDRDVECEPRSGVIAQWSRKANRRSSRPRWSDLAATNQSGAFQCGDAHPLA